MKRTTVFMTDDQRRRLDEEAKGLGVKVATLIRLYVVEGLDRTERKRKKGGR